MFSIEVFDQDNRRKGWREMTIGYRSAEDALRAAANAFEDEDSLITRIRIKETVTLCELVKPEEEPR